MKKFFEKVVAFRKIIVIVFSVLAIALLVCKMFVNVDYNMNDYLPEDSDSTIAISTMEKEFSGGIPNCRVMVQDVTIPEALEYKEKLAAIDGVQSVTWLDDSEDITTPEEMMDQAELETYYKDDCALFSVTIQDGYFLTAMDSIRDIIGEDNCITGTAASTAVATNTTVTEVTKITIIAVIFVFFVLILATNSWVDPFIILIGLGAAIAINSGSNIIFGTISFVTDAAGNVLQLAVSLDYSIFLIHCYQEYKQNYSSREEAMVETLCRSLPSILSSGLTTVIGFLALVLMRFQIGPDLGLALAKGVLVSLITVFVYVPGLIIMLDKYIDRFSHPKFMPDFLFLGKAVRKAMIPMIVIFCIVLVPAYLASNANSYYYGSSDIFGAGTQLGDDTTKIEEIFGKTDTYVLMVPIGDTATEQELSYALHDIDHVTSIISYVDTAGVNIPKSYLDEDTLALLDSENYTRFVISVDVPYEGDSTWQVIEDINDTAGNYYSEFHLAGAGVSTYDLKNTIVADMTKVNLIAIAAVFVVLLFTLRNAFLPVILVLSIETAIWINLAVPYFADKTIFYIGYLIISSIQLGATVDYAILFTDHYQENRLTMSKSETVIETVRQVTPSILVSGSALCVIGFLMGWISTNQVLSQLGTFLGRGGLLSLFIVIFVLPGLLFICDRLFSKKSKEDVNE